MEIVIPNSSLIKCLQYDPQMKELSVEFHSQDFQRDRVHYHVSQNAWEQLISAKSVGKFYLDYIKPVFTSPKNNHTMARKSDKIINLRIDVQKINKDWLFKGEKGTYLDCVIFYSETPDQYQTNGMVIQSVPKKIAQDDRNARGPILGNCKDWDTLREKQTERPPEAQPNSEAGAMAGESPTTPEWADDLPF